MTKDPNEAQDSEETRAADEAHDHNREASEPRKSNNLGRIIFTLITLACFAYLYYRINGAAAREGLPVMGYMAQVFAAVDWLSWIAVMVGYSLFYFLIDTLVVARALGWFIADIKYKDILPSQRLHHIHLQRTNRQRGDGLLSQ